MVTVTTLGLGALPTSIKTDNSNTATLTATAIDAVNAKMAGVPIAFATTSGFLSAASATTGADGTAVVTLSSGTLDASNRTATVTATAGGKTASIPVLISGSTLTLTPSAFSVQVGTGTITLSAKAMDAFPTGKNDQKIRFSIGGTSTGAGTLSVTQLRTGVNGTTGSVTFTPTSAGTVVATAEWLDSSGAVSVTATQNITVMPPAGVAFAITTPVIDPLSLATGGAQTLVVTVPATVAGTAVTSVRLSSSSGTWIGVTQVTASAASITQTPVANAVQANFTAPNTSGVVTVQVDALAAGNAVLSTLTRAFVVSAPAATAASLNLQTSVATIAPSSGGNLSTATLTATVRDAANNSVGNAAVLFELLGTTGSGESISPAVAYTDGTGKVTATFSAGSSTSGSVYVRARVVGQVCTGSPQAIPVVAETNAMCNSLALTVASTAVSVSIGVSTKISDTANNTQYLLPMSVLVVNTNGSAVANAVVTLSVFPVGYSTGAITLAAAPAVGCVAPPMASFLVSEDVNRNGILDPGEDKGNGILDPGEDINSNGILDPGEDKANGVLSPPQAAGGVVPATVTTDSNGVATFNLQYLKLSAWLIVDELTARVLVSGTERSAKTTFVLPISVDDSKDAACPLAHSGNY